MAAYAIMFFGHFVFERNIPTILKEPSTPFVIAGDVIGKIWTSARRLAKAGAHRSALTPGRGRGDFGSSQLYAMILI